MHGSPHWYALIGALAGAALLFGVGGDVMLAGVTLASAASIGALWAGTRQRRTADTRVVGRMAEVRRPVSTYEEGYVFVAGELWRARLVGQPTALVEGAWARVVGQEGLTLLVAPPGDRRQG